MINHQYYILKTSIQKIIIMSQTNQHSQKGTVPRHSKRLIKKIDRHTFASHYSPRSKQSSYINKISLSGMDNMMELRLNQLRNLDRQLSFKDKVIEMNRAFLEQKNKLYEHFQIKLQLGKNEETEVKHQQLEQIKQKNYQIVRQYQERYQFEGQSNVNIRPLQNWTYHLSQNDSHDHNHERIESMKLLGDNYQNNELVYSVESLIPRIAREDVGHQLIQHLN